MVLIAAATTLAGTVAAHASDLKERPTYMREPVRLRAEVSCVDQCVLQLMYDYFVKANMAECEALCRDVRYEGPMPGPRASR